MRFPLDRAFRGAVMALAGVFAAPFAHVAIDWLGDVALSRDAFDGVAHGSRGPAIALGLVLVLLLGVRLLWRALRGGDRHANAARASLERLITVPLWRGVAYIFPVALAGVVAMEALDLLAAGRAIDDPADLLSGSIPFGLAVTLACATLVAAAVRCFAWLAAATHARVVAVLACLLRDRGRLAPGRVVRRSDDARLPRRGARPVRCRGLRAPPIRLRA